MVLATKCGLVWHTTKGNHFFDYDGKPVHRHLGAESIAYELEQSLKRLGTDHVDLYITHWQDPTTPIAETMEALQKLKQQGKIRAIGASNLSPQELEAYVAVGGLDARGGELTCTGGLDAIQEEYSMVKRDIEATLLPTCRQHGVSMLSYSSLALGLLSGTHRPGPSLRRRRPAQGQPALLGRQPAESRRADARHRACGRGAWRDAGTDRHRLDAAAARNHLCAVRRAQSRPGARERRSRAHPAFVGRNQRHRRGDTAPSDRPRRLTVIRLPKHTGTAAQAADSRAMPEQRQQDLDRMRRDGAFDVVVLGGGINGIGVYRELALQGLRVLLVERNDFCSGCSAAPSRMIHGGLRYLENGEFGLVWESLRERDALLANAPHMVRPLPTTIPIKSLFSGMMNGAVGFFGLSGRPASRGALPIKIGLMLYDWITRHRRRLPRHQFRGARSTLAIWPALSPELRFSATYHDAWISHPERMGIELILDTQRLSPGSIALNHAELRPQAGGFTVTDRTTGEKLPVSARAMVNATGAWLDESLALLADGSPASEPFVSGTKGSHLILDHPALHDALGGHMIFFEHADGRVCIVFPYLGKVLAGSTDIRVDGAGARALRAGGARLHPRRAASRLSRHGRRAGARRLQLQRHPAAAAQRPRIHRAHLAQPFRSPPRRRRAAILHGRRQVDHVPRLRRADRRRGAGRTRPGAGGEHAGAGDRRRGRLSRSTGSAGSRTGRASRHRARARRASRRSLRHARRGGAGLLRRDAPTTGRSPRTARSRPARSPSWRDNEFALGLGDVLLRRTPLSIRGIVSTELIRRVAAILADELGWDEEKTTSEVEAFTADLADYHGVSREMLDRRDKGRS